MKTNCAYINEFSFLDDVMESFDICNKEVTEAVSTYNINKKRLEMKAFFESSDDIDILLEKEEEGLLSKIGNAIIKMIQKFADFISNITSKFKTSTGMVKSDIEKVNRILANNPELKQQVCDGLNKKWFTYRDIAQYEKDVVGLMQMLQKNAIDHRTFVQKMKGVATKFMSGGKTIIGVGTTIYGLTQIGPKISKGVDDAIQCCKNVHKSFKDSVDDFTSKFKDKEGFGEVISELTNASANMTEETTKRQKGQGVISGLLNDFIDKHDTNK